MADIKENPVCLKFCLRQGKITTGIYKTLKLACRVETMGKIKYLVFFIQNLSEISYEG
jgi:hypothetical protein